MYTLYYTPRWVGLDFADAATVLHDEQAITIRDDDEGEERHESTLQLHPWQARV